MKKKEIGQIRKIWGDRLSCLVFLMSGACGILSMFALSENIRCSLAVSITAAAAAAVFFSFLYKRKKRTMLAGSAMFLAGFLCAAIVFRKVLFFQYEHLRECIGGVAQGEKDVTAAVVSFCLFAIFLLFILEVRQTNRWILCLVSNLLLLSAPFLGLRPGVPSVLLLGCFQMVFWGIHMPKKRSRESAEQQTDHRMGRSTGEISIQQGQNSWICGFLTDPMRQFLQCITL